MGTLVVTVYCRRKRYSLMVLIILQSIHNAFWRGDGLGGIDPTTREAAKVMFDRMDRDKDGLVTEQEFLAACMGNTPPTKVKRRRWNAPFRKNNMRNRSFTDSKK